VNLIAATFALVIIELAFWLIAGGYALRVCLRRAADEGTVISDSPDTRGEV